MRIGALAACCLLFGIGVAMWPASAQDEDAVETTPAEGTTLKTEDEKTLYSLGLALGQNLGQFGLSEAELKLVVRGLEDSVLKRKAQVDLNEYMPKLSQFAQARALAATDREKKAAAELLEAEAAKDGAVKTDSGLIYTELKAGTGASPNATDTVKVHYHGTLRDGTVFDSSVDRGVPAKFPLNRVIPAWTEGVQKMKVGGKARLVCPSDLAYGDEGRPGIPGGAALIFEVELLEIVPAADGGSR